MTDSELNAKLAQLLTIVETGFAHLNGEIAGLKQDVAGLKQDVARLEGRMTVMENELIAVNTQQAIMNARLEDQWRIVATLISSRIPLVDRIAA